MLRDDTVLNTVRPISDLSTLYYEFTEYRLEMLADRFQSQLKKLRTDNRAGKKTAVRQLRAFIAEQEKFLAHMKKEVLPYEEVVKGLLPEEDIPNDAPSSYSPGLITPPDTESTAKRVRVE
jgi:ribosome-binding ATPase YchF (GTP1/OBG family)